MTITAKYPGTCYRCGSRFDQGEQIEWTKGVGSKHVNCVRSNTTPSTPMPDRPSGLPSNRPVPTVQPGVFNKDGEIYLVTKTKDGERFYAKQLREFQLDVPRILEDGTPVEYDCEWEYVRGVVFDLSEDDRMPIEQARELSIRYGRCLKCGRTLKARKSVEAGIGPVCRKAFGGTFVPETSKSDDDEYDAGFRDGYQGKTFLPSMMDTESESYKIGYGKGAAAREVGIDVAV